MRADQETFVRKAQGGLRAADGAWEVLEHRLPFPAAHAALVPGGKVLFLAGDDAGAERSRACLWDPATGSSRIWDFPADFSLGAQCFLPDGRLVLAGGGTEQGVLRLRQTYLFDPWAEDWVRVNDIPGHGPCPTLLELGDGRVLAAGGAGRSLSQVYEKSSGWGPATSQELDWPLYPQLTLLADGSILYSGQHFGGRSLLNPGKLRPGGAFTDLPANSVPPGFRFSFREQGGTVLLPPAQAQQVMLIAGDSPPKPDVHVIDFSQDDPVLRQTAPLNAGRANFSTVVLPDRSILVCGGRGPGQDEQAGVKVAELLDPTRASWRPMAPAEVRRPEHSSAVLMPDGRVLTAGSTTASGEPELRLEVFSPPYLFRGSRPRLEAAPDEIAFGEPFTIETADADIHWMSLVRPMAASHGFDPGQRLVDVPFASRGAGVLQALAPENANIAPPGWYLLFLVNHAGIPSMGKWVFLRHASASGTAVPSAGSRQQNAERGLDWPAPAGRAEEIGQDPDSQESVPGKVFWAETLEEPAGLEDFELESPRPRAPVVAEAAPSMPISPAVPPPAAPPFPQQFTPAPQPAPPVPQPLEPAPPAAPPFPQQFAPAPQPAPPVQQPLEPAPQPAPRIPPLAPVPPVDRPAAPGREAPLPEDVPLHAVPEAQPRKPGPRWPTWARPGLIIASGALLTGATFLQIPPLRLAAALVFLLIAPGMAVVGFFRPKDWATDLGLAVGLSIAFETLLSVAMLHAGTWLPERVLLIMMGVSLTAAAAQLVLASFGRLGATGGARG